MTNKEHIENLKSFICHFKDEIEYDGYGIKAFDKTQAEKDIETFEAAIQALEQTQWIPVSKMPKEDGLYLVYTEEQPFVSPFENGEFFIYDVLAWMPLPKSYKEEETDGR